MRFVFTTYLSSLFSLFSLSLSLSLSLARSRSLRLRRLPMARCVLLCALVGLTHALCQPNMILFAAEVTTNTENKFYFDSIAMLCVCRRR